MANGIEFIPALLLAVIMNLVGSLAKYAYSSPDQRVPLLNHVLVSLFAGMMMFLFSMTNGWSLYVMGIGCGAAGWQGASIIRRIHPPGFGPDGDNDDK
ncbi:hypothetical protein [Citrobacter sp. 50677481]|jgi:hypothetical protein|uniref:Holin n=1 Tax=Citrobacter amalonaticus TaxID=35703 RepID=A0A6N2W8X5_CITAM|nr:MULTISPECIES: hypothetical protein [Citrobacter]DAU58094.1 MAG TPA: holin [Caudoviricetes sp.]HCD7251460.1 hypothetical protein [Citrobacter farmeri]HCQ7755514.1 hypothetical protein [Citrobacter sedlakii]EKX8495205.1 hypothetical protein [Citrobacter amalonaticus]KSY33578.1 hypothetical protein APU02_01225 [Citrobacter sp. 50677481]